MNFFQNMFFEKKHVFWPKMASVTLHIPKDFWWHRIFGSATIFWVRKFWSTWSRGGGARWSILADRLQYVPSYVFYQLIITQLGFMIKDYLQDNNKNNSKNLLFRQTTILIQYITLEKIYIASCVRDITGSGKWTLSHTLLLARTLHIIFAHIFLFFYDCKYLGPQFNSPFSITHYNKFKNTMTGINKSEKQCANNFAIFHHYICELHLLHNIMYRQIKTS